MRSVLRKYYLLLVCTISLFSANNSLQAQNVLDQAGLTSATPAAAAYSTRKLSSSYTGAAVRIRRQSDNAVADLAFDVNGNISANSLATFVSGGTGSVSVGSFAAATNAFVSIWYDQSGNGRNATQTTAANQPLLVSNGVVVTSSVLNSKATLSFNGSSQFMDLPMSSSIINAAGTIAAVQVQPVLQSGFNAVVAWSLSGGTQGPGFGPLNSPGAFGLYTTWGPNNITLGPVAINQAYVLNATWSGNGSAVVQSRNGTIVNGSLGASFNYTGNALIGRDVGAFYNGNLAELIVSNTTITAGNRTAMETNQNNAYTNAGALNFDGSNDYVNLGNILSASYTKEAWVNISNAAAVNNFISGGAVSKHAFWAPSAYGNKLSAGHNEIWNQVQDPTALVAGQWYHVAVTYDAPTTTMKLYKNGVLVSTNNAVPALGGGNLVLLGAYDPNLNLFSGSLDEARIWSRVLCQTEIQNNMNAMLGGTQTGLTAYYKFNQGITGANNSAITTVTDASGNNNNGTMVGFNNTGATSNWVAGLLSPTALSPVYNTPVNVISGASSVCVNGTTTLTNTSTGSWSSSNTAVATVNASGLVTGVSAGTTVITFTGICSGVKTLNFTVNALPIVTASSNTPVNAGTNINLTASGATTYSWTGPNAFVSTTQNPTIANAQLVNAGVYSVTGTTNGCTGTATATVVVNALPATALALDGANDYVKVKDTASLDFAANDFTVETWTLKQANTVSYSNSGLVGKWNTGGVLGTNEWILNNTAAGMDNKPAFWIESGNTIHQLNGNTVMNLNQWYHLAVVRKGTLLSMYINGVLDASISIPVGTVLNNVGRDLLIGAYSLNAGNPTIFSSAKLDELRIWNRALCLSEINNNRNGELTGTQNGLVAYYKFNQGFIGGNNVGITTLTDASGNNNNGTLFNLASTATGNWVAGNVTGNSPTFVPTTAPITGTATACVGATSTLANINPGTWSSSNSSVATVNASGLVTAIAEGTTTITFTNACAGVSTISFTVKALPKPTIQNVGPLTFCEGGSVNLTAQYGGNALSFNGTNRVTVNNTPTIPVGNSTYTMEAWIKPNNVTGVNGLIGWGSWGSTNQVNALRFNGPTTLINYWWANDLYVTIPNVLDGKWHHVAATYNGTTRAIYFDGVLMGSDQPSGHNVSSGTPLYIAETYPAGNEYFNGSMDEVRIWNTGKTQAQIQASMNETVPVNSTGLVAYYKLDEISGLTTADATGNGNNGSLTGSPVWMVPSTSILGGSIQSVLWNPGGATTNNISVNSAGSYTATVTDNNGCTATTAPVEVTVNPKPTASISTASPLTVCLGGAVLLDASTNASNATYQWFRNGVAIPTATNASFNAIVSGSYTVVVANANGCVSNTSNALVVTIEDIIKPFFSSGGTVTSATNAQGQVLATSALGAVVTYNAPVGADNCSVVSNVLTAGFASGSIFPIGTTTVTYTVTDGAGLTEISSFDVVVVGQAPSLIAPSNITVNNDEGQCGATVSFAATGSVGVPAATITYTEDGQPVVSGQSFSVGVHTITATATNAVGSSSVNFTINVIDNQAPLITAPANISVIATSSQGAVVNYVAPVGTDNCSATTVMTAGYTSGSVFPIGVTTVTYKVTDASGNTDSASFTVTVSGLAPVIVAPANLNLGAFPNCSAVANFATTETTGIPASTITYTENGLPIVSGATLSVGVHTITATATNAVGSSSATFTIRVLDTTAPQFIGLNNPVVNTDENACSAIVNIATPNVIDNCTVISIVRTRSDQLPLSAAYPLGVTTINWSARDASNNTTYIRQTITVVDNQAPTITCPSNVVVNATSVAGAIVNYAAPVGTDNCSATTAMTAGFASGSTFPIGVTTVTYKVTDASGNSAECSFTVTVNAVAPVVVVPANITVNVIPNTCGAAVSFAATEATAIPASTITYTENGQPVVSGATFAKGVHTITATATNAVGSSSASFTITVVDNQAPVPNVLVLPDIIAECSVNNVSKPIATDNCSGQIIATTTSPLSYNSQGTYTITWKYTDGAGNSSNQTQKVIIKDTTAPTVICPAPIVVTAASNQCGAVVNFAQPVVTDNCSSGNTGVHTLERSTQFFDYANNVMENQSSPGLPMSFFPTDGQKMAVFLVNGSSTHYMYQNITLPSSGPITLGFDMKYTNHNPGGFSTSQFIAVELRNPVNNAIIATLFKTNPGALASTAMTHYSYDLSAYAGQQVRLQMIDATINNFYLDVQLDNITLPGSNLVNGSFETGNYSGWTVGSGTASYGTFGIGSGPGVSIVQKAGLPSGSTFPIGTTTNTFEVTDLAGNKTTCSFDVTVNAPEISISGNGTNIVNGDISPSIADNTNLGNTIPNNSISKTFVITNSGTSALVVSSINLNNSAFTRSGIVLPVTIQPGQTASFIVSFASTTLGVKTSTVTINSNDCNESVYQFVVNAEVTCTNPVFVNTNQSVQAFSTELTCNAIVNYPLAITGIPQPSLSYTFSGATVGSGIGTGSGQTFNVGTTHVIVTAINQCKTVIHEFDVIVTDQILPKAITQNLTITLNETGQASISASQINAGSTDNCGIASVVISKENFDCSNLGTNTVTLTVTDIHGNVSTAQATVTVIDNQVPVITSPANISVIATSAAGAMVTYVAPVGTDNCAVTTVMTAGLASGSTFPIGTTTVTYTATDASGNTASSSFTVTVVGVAPVIVVPENILQNNDAGQCGASVSFAATETTAIPASTIVYTENEQVIVSGHYFSVGTHTITATATNAVGSSSGTFTITILDTVAPSLTVPANISVFTDNNVCGAAVSFAATATDNCSPASISYNHNPGTVFPVGITTVTVTATDPSGNATVQTFTVSVTDKQAPVALAKNITVGLSAVGGTVSITAADVNNGSSDACGIASMTVMPASFSCANVGDNMVTLTVTDVNGNVSTTTAIVTVVDDKGPVPTAVLPVISGQCSVKLELVSRIHQDGDGCNSNDRERYHRNTKGKGHDKDRDGRDDHDGDDDDDDDHENNGAIKIIAPTAMDNCSGLIKGTTTDPLVYNNQGTYIIHWKFVDARGNVTIQEQTVIVKDTQAPRPKYASLPTITGQCSVSLVNTNSNDDDGDHEGRRDDDDHDGDDDHDRYNEHQMGAPWAKDNCSGWVRGTTTDPLTYSVQGTYIIHWTYNDGHGNISTQNQTVIVKDITKPKIKAPNDKTVTCGSNTAPAVMGMATATDNCSVPVITYTDVNSGNQIVRTWKATDAAGNSSTAVQTIKLSTAFSGSVVSVPTSNVYTGGEANNLYLGYGAQGTALTVTGLPSSGAPYTYSWTGVATNRLSATNTGAPVFSPIAGGVYTFTVTMTNKNGCSNTASISICVTDIRVPGSNGALVYVCHKGSGKTGGTKTLQVPVAQVASHIQSNTCGGKNDRLGSCDQNPCNSGNDRSEVDPKQLEEPIEVKPDVKTAAAPVVEELKVVVMPNPTTTYFTIRLESKDKAPVNLRVMDGSGRVIDAKQKMEPNSSFQMGHGYSSGTYYAEFIQGNKRKVIQLIKGRG